MTTRTVNAWAVRKDRRGSPAVHRWAAPAPEMAPEQTFRGPDHFSPEAVEQRVQTGLQEAAARLGYFRRRRGTSAGVDHNKKPRAGSRPTRGEMNNNDDQRIHPQP